MSIGQTSRFLIATFLLAQPLWGQTVQMDAQIRVLPGPLSVLAAPSVLEFPDVVVHPDGVWLEALRAPEFRIVDARGTAQGWHLSLQAQEFVHLGRGNSLGSRLFFQGSPDSSRVFPVSGDPVSTALGPREVSDRVDLKNGKVLYCLSGAGRGIYWWTPSANQFSLWIPGDPVPGRYQGQITITVVGQP